VTASFDVAEREFEFDQDPYNVTNAEGQAVSGHLERCARY